MFSSWRFLFAAAVVALLLIGCRERVAPPSPPVRPSILLVTLDTTRADAIGPGAKNVETPAFNALVRRGRYFTFAYAAVPQTLPSHTSIMTGLYPAGHGVHENARPLTGEPPLLAEELKKGGYRTAAFVSAFALARRYGLARGFDLYDDETPPGLAERTARETTERVLTFLGQPSQQPLFLWVHYYDPHYPYTPPEPYRTRYASQPYYGEVAAMDEQLGRLVAAFEQLPGPHAAVIAADHGEGLGDHGEAQHGNLMYQATMHVPLLILGPGVPAGTIVTPVSTRRIFPTISDFAGLGSANSLRGSPAEIVLGEAMKPFLDYSWQPQVMAVEGRQKSILAGQLEVYDVVADPGETRNLASQATLSRPLRAALQEYPVPSAASAPSTANMSEEERRKLASLGYVASTAKPVIRKDAPRAADMSSLFPVLDQAAALFVREEYAQSIPLLEQILARDPYNLDAALRLATAHSALGHEQQAETAFAKAAAIAPGSSDVRTYRALHYARGKEWQRAVPMLEQIVAEAPDNVPALEALAVVREREGRLEEAVSLRQQIYRLRTPTPAELVQMGALAMQLGRTPVAIEALERARAAQGPAFRNDLELGVLYLAANRLENAREALDRVPPTHPGYPMALFKRAQVSVLLHEPDQAARIDAARRHATPMTRTLIERERLFR